MNIRNNYAFTNVHLLTYLLTWCVCDQQVRDVLKGALKPTCLSDSESELASHSWMNAAVMAASVKQQLSEGSAHRSAFSTLH